MLEVLDKPQVRALFSRLVRSTCQFSVRRFESALGTKSGLGPEAKTKPTYLMNHMLHTDATALMHLQVGMAEVCCQDRECNAHFRSDVHLWL